MSESTIQHDARVQAFCSPDAPEVFRSVAFPSDVWTPDPFDIESIHQDAREAFERLLNLVSWPENQAGRILLIKGESGSGKTHLMRAFRTLAHQGGRAYFGYMQMTSSAGNYARYILNKLIDSLDRPYLCEQSGLMRLSTAVVEGLSDSKLEELRESDLSDRERTRLVDSLADELMSDSRFNENLDLIRAMLLLQCESAPIRSRVLKYLRGEPLSDNDREWICGIVPKGSEEEAQEMIERLARLMWRAQGAALILCIDQLEDIVNVPEREEKFRRAMQTVCAISGHVPTSLVVISCIEDYYLALRNSLTKPYLDRIENDPKPIFLKAGRSPEDIQAIVERRLDYLFRESGVDASSSDSVYPFRTEQLDSLTNLRARSILHFCHDYRQACIQAGELVDQEAVSKVVDNGHVDRTDIELEQEWNDFLNRWDQSPPEAEEELATLLTESIESCGEELETGHSFSAQAEGSMVAAQVNAHEEVCGRLMIGICNRNARGGGLERQVDDVVKLADGPAGSATPVIVRSTDFPASAKAKVVQRLVQVIKNGGRRVVVEDAD